MPDSSLGLPTSATDGDTRPQPIASTSQAAAAALSASGTRATGDEEQSKSKKGSKKGPRAAGGEAGEDGEPAKKRKRVSYSCTACAQRKAKCDRGRPCNTCSARGVGATCRYLVDGYDDPVDVITEVRDRLESMESLLASMSGQSFPSQRPSNSSQIGRSTELSNGARCSITYSDEPEEPQPGFVSQRGQYFGASASTSVDDQGTLASFFKASSAPRTKDAVAPTLVSTELLQRLPPRPLSDFFVTVYFSEINLTRYPISEPTFRSIYAEIWTLTPTSAMPANLVHQLPLVFIVLAIASLTAPANGLLGLPAAKDGSTARQDFAHGLFASACRAQALASTTFEGKGDPLTVMAELLKTRYLVLVRRAADGYEFLGRAVHKGYTMGLHRRRTGLPAADEENRRRIWSYVLHLDRYLSLLLGLPLTINEAVCDAPGPSNISDLDENVVLPMSTLTTSSFLILRHRLTKLMGRVVSEAFAVKPPYSAIVALEQALQDWADHLPEFFKLVPHGKAYDSPQGPGGTASVLEVQRYLLATEFRFIRTTLHRPYLASTGSNMALSRDACVASALDDLWSRLTAYPLRGMENLSSGSYRVTLSIVVLGVAMLLSPSSDTSQRIHDCLLRFAAMGGKQADADGNSLVDEPTFRQVATRELNQLKARITGKTAQLSHPRGTSTPRRPLGPPAPPAPLNAQSQPESNLPLPRPSSGPDESHLVAMQSSDIFANAQNMLNIFPPLDQQHSFDLSGFTPFPSIDYSNLELGLGNTFGGGDGSGTMDLNDSGGDINWDIFNDVLGNMETLDPVE